MNKKAIVGLLGLLAILVIGINSRLAQASGTESGAGSTAPVDEMKDEEKSKKAGELSKSQMSKRKKSAPAAKNKPKAEEPTDQEAPKPDQNK